MKQSDMKLKEGREYRMVTQPFSVVEDSEGDEGACIVEGYATTFDVPYAFGLDGMQECIRSNAFAEADMSDVIFQFDHQGMVMARLRNKTLSISCDTHGLFVHADLKGCEQGRNLYEGIKNGLVDRMSWAFHVPVDGWEYDENTRTSYITKVDKVYDVSAVSLPANEDTIINARSYFDGVIEQEKQQELLRRSKERDERERLSLYLSLANRSK